MVPQKVRIFIPADSDIKETQGTSIFIGSIYNVSSELASQY